jgi:hypothetical protein
MAARRLVAAEGTVRAARLLNVSASTLDKIRGGLRVRKGSLLLVAKSLSELAPPAPAVRP